MYARHARSLEEEVKMAIERGETRLSHQVRNRWITAHARTYKLTLGAAAERVDEEISRLFEAMKTIRGD